MKRTYKFRLFTTEKQEDKLEEILSLCRFLYNSALEERREAYKKAKISLSYNTQQNELPEVKEIVPELNTVYSQTLQDVLRRLDKAFQAFFRRIKNGEEPGYPRFKGKDRYDSFTYPQSGFVISNNKITLSKVGSIRIKQHREIKGQIKTCTIKREAGKWYVCITTEKENAINKKEIITSTGIDVGINSFVTLSSGEEINNPRWFRTSEEKLAVRQRKLSKKKRGSNNKKKAKLLVQKANQKIKNQRKDFQHKLSRDLVNKFDLIAFEDLNIKGMIKNHKLSKSIQDVSWGSFIGMIRYKAEEAGAFAIPVNPRNTSQRCSDCGFEVKKTLSERIHHCNSCGLVIGRDHNAAINILKLGLSFVKEQSLAEAPCL